MQYTVTIEGLPELLAKLEKLGKAMDFEPEFRTIGEYLKGYYSGAAFMSQGQVFSAPWAPLKPATTAQKKKLYPGRQPLERTGTMREGFSYVASRDGVAVTNPVPYFKYHQSDQPRSRLPRRIMMGINDPVKEYAQQAIKAGVDRIISQNGL